jgi:hypothetical protein
VSKYKLNIGHCSDLEGRESEREKKFIDKLLMFTNCCHFQTTPLPLFTPYSLYTAHFLMVIERKKFIHCILAIIIYPRRGSFV